MQQIFSGLNALEAHVISHLLEAAGIKTSVNGEHLVGARGDLPVHDMCSVWVVDDADALRAKTLVAEWEKKNPAASATNKPDLQKSGASIAIASLIGFFLGAAIVYSFFYSPATQESIDYNWDGKQDAQFFYRKNMIFESWYDLNFDGDIDSKDFYDQRGFIKSTSMDTDGDGTMETNIDYKYGQAYKEARDYNADGKAELIFLYPNEYNNSWTQIFDPITNRLVKLVEFKNGKAIKAQYDSDKDGVLDTEYTYDDFEEIKTKTTINKN